MSAMGQVQGKVEYRLGDGPLLCVPPGDVEIDVGRSDVTLSWENGPTRQSTAIPSSDFTRYVDARAIVLNPSSPSVRSGEGSGATPPPSP